MKIKTRKKCDRLIKDIEALKKQGIELVIRHGKYGNELTLVDDIAASPGDYIVAVVKTNI